MTTLKAVSGNPYDAVLADLRSKREQLDNTIRILESLRDGQLGITPPIPSEPAMVEADADDQDAAGMFLGMSIVDAAKKLLKLRKRAMSNSEILQAIQAGGVVLTGADPLNVVGSVLTRRFNNVGDVVRVNRGTWGLKEWYPGRNFKPTIKAVENEIKSGHLVSATYAIQMNDLGGEASEDDDI